MKEWVRWAVLITLALFFLGCAGAQVKPGERLRVAFTGDTWGALFPSG